MTDSPVNNPLTRRSPNRLSKPVPGSIPHRRTGEGRYPGDGRGNPHNRHPPPTPHFPTTVVPAKAGTQGTGAATTQPSSPTLTGHPPPTVFPDVIRNPLPTVFPAKAGTQGSGVTRIPGPDRFRHGLPTPMINGPAHAEGPHFHDKCAPGPYLTPKPAAIYEGSRPHAAAPASSRMPCRRLRRHKRLLVSRPRFRGARETDRAPLQESHCRS